MKAIPLVRIFLKKRPGSRMSRVRSGLPSVVILFFASLQISVPFSAHGANRDRAQVDDEIPFAIAVRGGVSLGSYEAGINWAIIKYMKALHRSGVAARSTHVQLKAVSGASAGSINSLLTAISWCIDDTRTQPTGIASNSLTSNLFHDSWLGVGFDELLPEPVDSDQRYRSDDGVLTRNAFNPAINGIKNILSKGLFRANCSVPVGLLVTRVDPVTMTVAGVEVQNQRFMVPVEFFTDTNGRAGFTMCDIDPRDPLLGNILVLPGRRAISRHCPYLIQTNDVIDTIEASSAFPLAFGRKQLRYCERDEQQDVVSGGMSQECPTGYRTVTADFVDGGLFDNIPLGAAKALAEPHAQSERTRKAWQRSARRYNYIYLDPTIRRPSRSSSTTDPTEPGEELDRLHATEPRTFGLKSQTGFLLGAIRTGRDYELYNVLRGGDWGNQVFSYAEKLVDVVLRQYPETPFATKQSNPDFLFSKTCNALFSSSIDLRNLPTRSQALSCVMSHAQALEAIYAGQAVAGRQINNVKTILRLRNTIIDWTARIATAAGETQLALSVQQVRDDKLGDRRILLSRRFSPLTGEMVFFFGAFADPDFRQYDYFAGVYDAVWGIANYICERRADAAACLPVQMHNIYDSLSIRENLRANTVFDYLVRREYPEAYANDPGWAWARERAPRQPDGNMRAIANSLFGKTLAREEWPYQAPKIGEFISRLTQEQYDTHRSSKFLKRVFTLKDGDQLSWYYPLTLRASNRLLLLEKRESKVHPDGKLPNVGLALGAFVTHSYVREEDFTFNNSTAPDYSWQAWLPNEIAVDARNGGLDVSWEPSVNIGNRGFALGLKLTPIQFNRYGGNEIWFSHADLFVAYRRRGIVSSFGAGPTLTYTWEEWSGHPRASVGASAYVGFLQDKLRITAGTLSYSGDTFPGDKIYLNFGLTDIPGIVYWLSKAM